MAAHEVMQPLVASALASLEGEDNRDLAAAFYDYMPEAINHINAAVSKMERLVSAILKLARLGRRELMPQKLDMNKIVRETLASFAYQIKAGGVNVAVADLPETIADRVSMEQIFSNLLGNALNYLDPDRAGEIEISAESRMDETVFHVRDNGRGIKDSDLKKVFNIFERLGNHAVDGEGMGLAYVQALVRRHRGEVYCQSEYGAGTEFTFTLSKRLILHEDIKAD
jgi:signal transduction histidine kinase